MSGEIEEGSKAFTSCMREKYFSEQEDNQRILILKNELKRTQQQVQTLCDIVNKLMVHYHCKGMIVTSLQKPNEESYGELYFRVEEFK